ncbi:hypothetical protein SEA_FORZA_29 [Gordonia phage Forza]|uniref:Uncharacterized protein n=1 Tax=Gordonia phage Forza TaxID=2571247 RepID=A0A650FAW0_9CAUD|nr:hypothetical protein PP303_gp029 [Gordonia phage Forza]QGT55022.1 hypothetical protein SEA_FORZA_29 [Gordonia phage Forza]UXE04171.1 hypothetical protein SEA_BLUENGOLD_27 [Gordonia phage BlueNGold]WBF03810.1 hypothetical protein SEA_MAREELIH_27 [Gordonia phage Mareelih]
MIEFKPGERVRSKDDHTFFGHVIEETGPFQLGKGWVSVRLSEKSPYHKAHLKENLVPLPWACMTKDLEHID